MSYTVRVALLYNATILLVVHSCFVGLPERLCCSDHIAWCFSDLHRRAGVNASSIFIGAVHEPSVTGTALGTREHTLRIAFEELGRRVFRLDIERSLPLLPA